MLISLIILDLFWSGAAWVYDLSKLATIPLYLWPIIAVCPIYPLLLALVLLQLYLKKSPNQFLLAFAVIPSIVFGALAIVFYPIAMYYQGFSWNALGQIFWVLFYALQGLWLARKLGVERQPFITASIFLIAMLIFQFLKKSYGYLDFTGIPVPVLLALIMYSTLIVLLLKRYTK